MAEKTLYESARRAQRPWETPDSGIATAKWTKVPQQDIDICLECPLNASACDICDGHRNISVPSKRGRRSSIDPDTLRRLMKLRKTNRELCNFFGVDISTIKRAKKIFKEEAE